MAVIDPQDKAVGRNGDVMARGQRGWGPRALATLFRFGSALTNNALARWDAATNKLKNSGVIVDDSNNVSGIGTLSNSGIHTNTNATASTTTATGAHVITGGLGVGGAVFAGSLNTAGNIAQTGATTISTGTGTNTLNGNVVVTTGKTITTVSGIIFSDETLSQYDEGTWTPTIKGDGTAGTPTYTTQFGKYTRIGNVVHAVFRVAISAKTGIAGNIQIGGLPFNIDDGSGSDGSSLTVGYYDGLTFSAGLTQLTGYAQDATTVIGLWACGSATTPVRPTDAGLAAASTIFGVLTFHV